MAQYKLKDSNPNNGFFNKLKADRITEKVQLVRSYDTENGKKTTAVSLTGNLLPNCERLKRAKWDGSRNQYLIEATNEQLLEWAKDLGFTDSSGRFVERVSKSNRLDPFITSIQVKITSDYVLDDETTLGKVHKAVLLGRNDINFGAEDKNLTEYDKRHNVQYNAIKLGDRFEDGDVVDVEEYLNFGVKLAACTLDKKVKIVESLGVNVPPNPEEPIINSTIYKKFVDEGDKRVGHSLQSNETNKEKINRMLDADPGELETEYIISIGIIGKFIQWIPNNKRYEYLGYDVGRTVTDVEVYFKDDKNSDLFGKLASEIKERQAKIKNVKK